MTSGVQSIQRTIAIVRAVARTNRRGSRLTDVARSVGLTKSTTHRILGALVQAGWLEQDRETGLFHLGVEIFALGAAAANHWHLAEVARPMMARLAERSEDTVYLQVRTGFESICAARQEGSYPIKTLQLDVGQRRPLGVSAGNIAILALLSDEDVERAITATIESAPQYEALDKAALLNVVAVTRQQGHAFVDGLFIAGMSAIGVPILGWDGGPVASLSVAAISSRLQDDRRPNIVAWLHAEARSIAERLERPERRSRASAKGARRA